MIYQIIFYGYENEHDLKIYEGTSAEAVYQAAYCEYRRIIDNDAIDEHEDFTDIKTFTQFCICKPPYIPTIDHCTYIHISYRTVTENVSCVYDYLR